MFNIYFFLFYEFVKVGFFTFGGGYASLPFLYQMADKYNWYSSSELTQMIAISGITPGPIGLNMATFAGFKTLGIIGAIVASLSLIFPMILITTQVFRFYSKFSENKIVKSILYILRPTSCALICCVGIKLIYNLILKNDLTFKNIDYFGLALVVFLFLLTLKLKRDPLIYIAIAAIIGIVVKFC